MKPISILAPAALGNEIGFVPPRESENGPGKHDVTYTWKKESATFIHGDREIAIPVEILQKAERNDSN